MSLTFEKYDAEHQKLWDTMRIIRDASQLERIANRIKKHQAVYEAVQKDTGVPWQMVAVIHLREAGESDIGVWKGVLHNGEKIVGTNRKTRIVPIGRGPFSTWHEAAVHALKEKKFNQITAWTPAKMLSGLEPYNGYGYRNKGIRSPYLWASTNHQQSGKYVADHEFNRNVMDTQVGCAAQLRYLGVGAKTSAGAGTAGAVIVTGIGAATQAPTNYIPWIIAGTIIVALITWAVVRGYKNRQKVSIENRTVDQEVNKTKETINV